MSPEDLENLLELDRRHVWHPYAAVNSDKPVYPVVSASGVRLTLAGGKEVIDGMSSWWSAIHGYNHPALNEAARKQLDQMSHVMFGGLTHPPAVRLCETLVDITPPGLEQVFLSDSGSVAVEVAIKMAIQYWASLGNKKKHHLLTIRSGYHGDTFGAMSVCDPVTGMHHLFSGVLPQHYFADSPACRFGESWDEDDIHSFKSLIQEHHTELAAVILEPVVQGAGGMRFYHPEYLRRVRQLCDEHHVLLIADEIATGFGRTGKLFACEHARISPDILCIGKALTGGYLSLAATLCSDKISQGICNGEAGVFMHGPTFMGNPLACAIANASIKLLLNQDWQAVIRNIESRLAEGLEPAKDINGVADVRVLGGIGVIEMQAPVDMQQLQEIALQKGIWIRPFGKLVYTMPPYIISDNDLENLTSGIAGSVALYAKA
jgi:adenosylmethionine-8-amino-7-oxononanoate aminotransferase